MTRRELLDSTLEQLDFERVLEYVARFSASSLGSDHLAALTPLEDANAIRREWRLVSEARTILADDERIPVDGIYDIARALSVSTVSNSYLGGEDLNAVLSTMQGMRRAKEFFASRDDAPELSELTEPIHTNRLLEKHISESIDDSGKVRDTASRELFNIRREIIDKGAELRARLKRILRRVADEEMLTDEFVTLREGRMVLPVRVENKRKIPGIIHGESNTGATVFLEPSEIFDMNNEIAELTFSERREVERILRTLTGEIGAEADQFSESLHRVALLDSAVARARYALERGGAEPQLAEDGVIRLTNAHHPVLQIRLDEVVPLDISFDPDRRVILVSGPNAGGKTVAMKTVGLITALALAGLHPPADVCVVHPCGIFSDIGDRQSVESDLSTFSAHVSRIGDLIANAREGDLVLLDELGTGTDPDEGAAIAAAILDDLLEKQAVVMATTHHSALKVYAYETDGVENAGMEFDTETLTPSYHLSVGLPGNSYAFELVERLGLPDAIIANARGRLGEDRNAMSDILEQLERSLAESRKAESERHEQLQKVEAERRHLSEERETLRSRKEEILQKARREAAETIDNASALVENTLREIREGASNDRVKQMRETLRAAVPRRAEKGGEDDDRSEAIELQRGDTVRIREGGQIGEIEQPPDDQGNVVVQLGSIRMRAHSSELEPVARKEKRRQERSVRRDAVVNAEELSQRVDLRGMYSDEAGTRIEQAISAALGSGIDTIEIIHGKGTGALRKRTHEILKSHPQVSSFRLGNLTEGGAGVTIVELN